MINILLFSFSLISMEKSCDWKIRSESVREIGSLLYEGKKLFDVEDLGSGSKLVKCERKFSNILLIEVDLGETGTTTSYRKTDLKVFDLSKNEIIHSRNVEIVTQEEDQKGKKLGLTKSKFPYSVKKLRNGKVVLIDGHTHEQVVLVNFEKRPIDK